MPINSYSSPFTMGHRATTALLETAVVVEEKIDGSQFSFGVNPDTGELEARSRRQALELLAPEGMFERAVASIQAVRDQLTPGWVYRAEYLQKPKHNTLSYERVPLGHIVVYDIDTSYGGQHYLAPFERAAETERLGFEPVRVLFEGTVFDLNQLKALVPLTSQLGGPVEGIVIKQYLQYAPDKKVLMAKVVNETFKEKHQVEWGTSNPGPNDILTGLATAYRTDARWQKAVQHLTEAGSCTGTPQDIGPLIHEIQRDILLEEEQAIKDTLFAWAWPHLKRSVTRGLPEWYKQQLLEQFFEVAV